MPPDLNITYQGERHEPTPATLLAWESRAYMLEYANSEPDSEQAIMANQLAHEKFGEVIRLTWHNTATTAYFGSQGVENDIDDILQVTYTRAFRGLPGFRGDANIETWLEVIMLRQLQTLYGKKAKERSREVRLDVFGVDDADEFLGQVAIKSELEPEHTATQGDKLESVIEMLDQLEPKHKKIILLAHYYDRSHEQIAHIMGTSVGNSKTILRRALIAFHKKFPNAKEILEE